MALMFFVN